MVNLKALNSFVQTEHFKMEGVHTLKELVNPEDWLTKEDLKVAYFTIPVQQGYQYLWFLYEEKCYQFTCLPFGLSSAPWVQNPEASPSSPLGDGGTIDSLLRQHPCPGGVQVKDKESGTCCGIPLAGSGFPDKSVKFSNGINPSDGIPGLDGRS